MFEREHGRCLGAPGGATKTIRKLKNHRILCPSTIFKCANASLHKRLRSFFIRPSVRLPHFKKIYIWQNQQSTCIVRYSLVGLVFERWCVWFENILTLSFSYLTLSSNTFYVGRCSYIYLAKDSKISLFDFHSFSPFSSATKRGKTSAIFKMSLHCSFPLYTFILFTFASLLSFDSVHFSSFYSSIMSFYNVHLLYSFIRFF